MKPSRDFFHDHLAEHVTLQFVFMTTQDFVVKGIEITLFLQ